MKIFKNKWVKVGLGVVIGSLAVLWVAGVIILKREDARKLLDIKAQADKFDQLQEMIEADNYGGKTPQETLQMFIAAVEAGDYELASKYFVVEKQREWNNNLLDIEKNNKFDIFLPPVKKSLSSKGEYSEDKKTFSFYKPILVEFILYPYSVWKINEI